MQSSLLQIQIILMKIWINDMGVFMKKIITIMLCMMLGSFTFGDDSVNTPLVFETDNDEYLSLMKKESGITESETKEKKEPKADISNLNYPKDVQEFTKVCFFSPVSQGMTGSCWCFSSTSFFEAEFYRLNKKEIKLSEMYGVYYEYVEKAKRFIEKKGDSRFSKGSQPNATIRIWKKYGIVPLANYSGKKNNEKHYDHTNMFNEMEEYLNSLREKNEWNENEAISKIKSILNNYMGEPPSKITYEGKEFTPGDFLRDVLKLNLDDYYDVMSLKQKPFYQKVEYEVADNWWHSEDYYNVPLDVFMKIVISGIENGYTICIVGDTSESGYIQKEGIAFVPSYDITAESINDDARQIRFSEENTTDDHAIHIVGYTKKDGKYWFLIKDSGSSARNNKNHKGYFFYSEDYIKLKMMNILIHKDAYTSIVKK